jgi:hypothetical protein
LSPSLRNTSRAKELDAQQQLGISLNDHRSPVPLYITALAAKDANSNTAIRKLCLPVRAVKAIRAVGQLFYVGYALLWKLIRRIGRDVFAREVRLPDTFGLR